MPPSYKEFVLRFGNAKLYRQPTGYLVQVFAGPREAASKDGESLFQFGRTHTSLAYFKDSLLVAGAESPVFEWRHGSGLRRTASGFEEWLIKKCASARKRFKKKRWQEIEKGPPPFTEQEQAIVAARRKFRWRITGLAPTNDLLFEIHNGSNRILPYFSLGVRGKDGSLDGGVWLPVSSITPGETKVIAKGCYKELNSPHDVEVYDLPDPGPEDRDRYWEFRKI